MSLFGKSQTIAVPTWATKAIVFCTSNALYAQQIQVSGGASTSTVQFNSNENPVTGNYLMPFNSQESTSSGYNGTITVMNFSTGTSAGNNTWGYFAYTPSGGDLTPSYGVQSPQTVDLGESNAGQMVAVSSDDTGTDQDYNDGILYVQFLP